MSRKEIDPLKQATSEIPINRTEKLIQASSGVAHLPVLIPIFVSLSYLNLQAPTATRAIIGGVIYMGSVVLDHRSTDVARRAIDNAQRLNIRTNLREENPVYRRAWESERSLVTPSTMLFNGLGLIFSATYFPFAVSAGIVKTLATRNNNRIAKRLNRAADIAQGDL